MNDDTDLFGSILRSARQRALPPSPSSLSDLLLSNTRANLSPVPPSSVVAAAQRYLASSLYQPINPVPVQSELQKAFLRLKSNLEPTHHYADLIEQKHNAVRNFLENSGITPNTKLIGSLQRKTRIQPRTEDTFDIDILVQLGEFTHWVSYGGVAPQDAMDRLIQTLRKSDRYSAMHPIQDQPTVVFEHANGIKIELVPAYLDNVGHSPDGSVHYPAGRAYWIPMQGKWQLADYDFDADFVTKRNLISDKWVIPTIKMLKAIKRNFFFEMLSYHIEILAAGLIPVIIGRKKRQGQSISYPGLITDFLVEAEPLLTTGHRPDGSNSPFTQLDSIRQSHILSGFRSVRAYCQSIRTINNESSKIKLWRELFGEPFTLE